MSSAYHLGAAWRQGLPPGVYERTSRPETAPRDVRMDVAAFVGLTERGPPHQVVSVGSWGEFQQWFGRVGGGRMLPRSVQLFFANGGRRCLVVRVVDAGASVGSGGETVPNAPRALWRLPGLASASGADAQVLARDPGAWGNDLMISVRVRLVRLGARFGGTPTGHLTLLAGTAPSVGTTLRALVVGSDGRSMVATVHAVTAVDGASLQVEPPLPASFVDDGSSAAGTERVNERLQLLREVLVDVEVRVAGRTEVWAQQRLHPAHPSFLWTTLGRDSLLVSPRADQVTEALTPSADLAVEPAPLGTELTDLLREGGDDSATITRGDFFTAPLERLADEVDLEDDDEGAWSWLTGLGAFEALDAWDDMHPTEPVSLVCAPDLAHPRPDASASARIETAGEPWDARFDVCEVETGPTVEDLVRDAEYPNLLVDHDRDGLEDAQRALVGACEARLGWMAILDVPPDLDAGEAVRWRRFMASDHAAAYTPYLEVVPGDGSAGPLIGVPPCGFVCGIVARRERARGVGAAPANEELRDVVRVIDGEASLDPGFLHEESLNAIRNTVRGLTLLGARTTSLDPEWAHVSVRRMVDWLQRQLIVDTQWAVFEPNEPRLWRRLTMQVTARLLQRFRNRDLQGQDPSEAFFVRCDPTTNTGAVIDAGQCVVLVGVAPSVPAEFVVFRLTLSLGGDQRVEVGRA